MDSYPLDEFDLCTVCREGSENFDAVYSFGSYEGPLRKLIHSYKYGGVRTLAPKLASLLNLALPRDEQFDVIIPMPMHWRKRIERGFNQTEPLAKEVARRYGLKPTGHLRRTRKTAAQAGLDEHQRQDNLKGSFAVKRLEELAGKHILLIDDVFTTGATLRAATKVLRKAKPARISALTLARVDAAPKTRKALTNLSKAVGIRNFNPEQEKGSQVEQQQLLGG